MTRTTNTLLQRVKAPSSPLAPTHQPIVRLSCDVRIDSYVSFPYLIVTVDSFVPPDQCDSGCGLHEASCHNC